MAALVRGHGHRVGVFAGRRVGDLRRRPVVPEMHHLGAAPLEQPPEDMDRGVVSVEERRRGDEAERSSGRAIRRRRGPGDDGGLADAAAHLGASISPPRPPKVRQARAAGVLMPGDRRSGPSTPNEDPGIRRPSTPAGPRPARRRPPGRGFPGGVFLAAGPGSAAAVGARRVGLRLRLAAVQPLAQRLPGAKERDPLGRNHDRLAGAGIAGAAGFPVSQPEAAETADFHFLAGAERAGDGVEDGLDDEVGVPTGDLRGVGDLFGEPCPGDRRLAHRFQMSPIFTEARIRRRPGRTFPRPP